MGRIAGFLKDAIAPVGFTALTTGIGLASGQDFQRALTNGITGVGGAYAGEVLASHLLPKARFKLDVKGKPVDINLAGLGGSIAGGWLGTQVGTAADRGLRGDQGEGGDVNPLLLAVDEMSLPALAIGRALLHK